MNIQISKIMADTPLYLQAHFREQVKDAFEAAIQQETSKFADAGMVDSEWTADQIVFRTGIPVSFVETTGQRGGLTQRGEYSAGFRSGFVRDFECGLQFDRNDSRKLYTANLPTSEVQADMRRAWMRKQDDVFIEAAMAQALGGPKPYITAQANPAFMTIPVDWAKTAINAGVNSALTIWKIQEAKRRMRINDVDLDSEMLCLAISPDMEIAWMTHAENAKNDTFAKIVATYLENPSKGILGCKVIVTNKLTRSSTSTSIQQALIFTKRAFKVNAPSYEIKIDELPGERHATSLVAYAKVGVVRRWDELVCGAWVDFNGVVI
jgi:hypothetical protein